MYPLQRYSMFKRTLIGNLKQLPMFYYKQRSILEYQCVAQSVR